MNYRDIMENPESDLGLLMETDHSTYRRHSNSKKSNNNEIKPIENTNDSLSNTGNMPQNLYKTPNKSPTGSPPPTPPSPPPTPPTDPSEPGYPELPDFYTEPFFNSFEDHDSLRTFYGKRNPKICKSSTDHSKCSDYNDEYNSYLCYENPDFDEYNNSFTYWNFNKYV